MATATKPTPSATSDSSEPQVVLPAVTAKLYKTRSEPSDVIEDAVQEAYTRLLEQRAKGSPGPTDAPAVVAWLHQTAVRWLADRVTGNRRVSATREVTTDPEAPVFGGAVAIGADPSNTVVAATEDAEALSFAAGLPNKQVAATFVLCYEGKDRPREISRILRVTERRAEHLKEKALKLYLEWKLEQGSPAIVEARDRLLQDIQRGELSKSRLRFAKARSKEDRPIAAALDEFFGGMQAVILVLPVDLISRARGGSLLAAAGYHAERAKDAALSLFTRAETSDAASGLTQGAGAGGTAAAGGVVAKLGAGAAFKTIGACIAAGGAATACVAAGVVPGVTFGGGKDEPTKPQHPAISRAVEVTPAVATPIPDVVGSPAAVQTAAQPAQPQPKPEKKQGGGEAAAEATEAAETSSSPLAEPDSVAQDFEPIGDPIPPSPPTTSPSSSSSGAGASSSNGSDFGP